MAILSLVGKNYYRMVRSDAVEFDDLLLALSISRAGSCCLYTTKHRWPTLVLELLCQRDQLHFHGINKAHFSLAGSAIG